MTLGGILILLTLLVSLIVFVYIIVMCARGWGVLHTILLCTLFIECWVFMVFAAGVQATRVKYTADADKAKKSAEAAAEQTQTLLYGNLADIENFNAVIPAKGQLQRLTADRGRVWRNISFVGGQGGQYSLDLSASNVSDVDDSLDPAAAAAPTAPANDSLPVDLVVYAFSQEPNANGTEVPNYFLGEYRVQQSANGTVQLEPTLSLSQKQQTYISSGAAATWTLYELIPLDNHKAFAAEGSEPTDEAIKGRMDEDTIRELFAGIQDDNRRESVIDRYLRDGTPVGANDPDESIWVKVNVKKEYKLVVDSQDDADATERSYFDFEGKAIDVRLKVGDTGEVALSPGNTTGQNVIMKMSPDTQSEIDNGTFELVERFYVRPLIDYERAFDRVVVRSHEVREATESVTRETAELQSANQLGQEMISFRQVENQDLAADLQSFQKENQLLAAAVQESKQALSNLKAKLGKLYREVQTAKPRLTSTK